MIVRQKYSLRKIGANIFCQWIFIVGMITTMLSGCSSTMKLQILLEHSSFDIPMYGKTPHREFVDSSSFTFPLTIDWEYDASAGFGNGSPIIIGNILFMGTLQGELHAVNIQTGKSVNEMKTFAPISSSPVVFQRYLIVGNESIIENLNCFNTENGDLLWTRNVGGVVASPMISDSLLFVGGLDGKFYCLQPVFNEKKWSFDTGFPIRSSPCAWEDLVFCASTNGQVYAFERNTGTLRWQYTTKNAVFAGLTVCGGKLFVGSRDSSLYILDAASGTVARKISVGDKIMAAPSVDRQTVYIPSLDGALSAYSLDDGTLKWKFHAKSALNTPPMVTPSAIFVASLDKFVYALSPADGSILWKHEFDSRIKTTPLVWKNSLIIAAENRNIYLLR